MKRLHYLSLTTAFAQVIDARGELLAIATSFFYETSNSELFLITNWHNVTGRSASRPWNSRTGAVPCSLTIKLHRKQKQSAEKPSAISIRDVAEVSVPINSENGDEPLWLEHPDHKYYVDAVGIRITDPLEFREKYEFNVANRWREYHADYEPEAMDDVFVVGFPWGLSSSRSGGGGLPIYKRGCIASDPVVDFNQLPCVLIDCRTTSAMSGSPVIASRSGMFHPDGGMSPNSVIGTVSRFLGVYSARRYEAESALGPREEASEIGVVWKASALEAIVERGESGTPLTELAR